MNNSDYINGFSCAIKEDKSEVVLVVYKNYPIANEDGDFEKNACDVVSTLIMTTATARNLHDALGSLLDSDELVEISEDKEK